MTEIRTETRGSAVVNRVFSGYEASAGHIESLFRGKLVSMEQGQATGYALNMIEDRGVLFIEPGTVGGRGERPCSVVYKLQGLGEGSGGLSQGQEAAGKKSHRSGH